MSAQNSNHIIDVIKLDDNLWLKGVRDKGVGPADKQKCKIYKTHDGRKFKHGILPMKYTKKWMKIGIALHAYQSKAVDSSEYSSIE